MDKNFQHFLLSVAYSKAANLQCTFHRTNTRKRRSAPKSLMDPQHLAEGSFPKDDEKSVYESFLCKHMQFTLPNDPQEANRYPRRTIFRLARVMRCV